jgi:hypothetical protein
MAEDLGTLTAIIASNAGAQTIHQSNMIAELKMIRTKADGNKLAEKEIATEQITRDKLMVAAIQAILPPLEAIADQKEDGGGWWQNLLVAFKSLRPFVIGLGVVIGTVLGTVWGVVKAMGTVIKAFTPKWVSDKWVKITKFLAKGFGNFKWLATTIIKTGLAFVESKFRGLVEFLSKGVKGISTWIKELSILKEGSVVSKLLKPIISGFRMVKNFFTTLGKPFVALNNIGKGTTSITKGVMTAMKTGGSAIKTIFSGVKNGLKVFGGLIGKVAGFVSKIAAPLMIVMGAFETITAMMDEWGKGDSTIISTIGAGIKALVNFIIMQPLDMLKDLVSWIAEKLGMDGVSEALDSFSFSDMFSTMVDTVVGWIDGALDWMKETLSAPAKFIKDSFMNSVQFLFDLILAPLRFLKKGVSALIDMIPGFSAEEPIDMDATSVGQGSTPNEELAKQAARRARFSSPLEKSKPPGKKVAVIAKVPEIADKMEVVKAQEENVKEKAVQQMMGGQDRNVSAPAIVSQNTDASSTTVTNFSTPTAKKQRSQSVDGDSVFGIISGIF